ncbi:helix-turn-helix domain-containing protein [Nocardioides marinquilinus]|uniref:Helix-turn-helix domain-containing protein n=1 Tax=Nocardioides marinquilinus TaxID=1210400 RepID=A0ABP9P9V7_9ACTN
MPRDDVVHDPQVLRAIAHPVRNRILSELDAQGSMRAADLARELGVPANQASFHLRQLAKYGLVEEDPDAARDRRDRVWRAAHAGGLRIDLRELEAAPGGKAAARVFRRNAAAWAHVLVDRVFSAEREPDEHRSSSESALRLTKDEATELTTEIGELVRRYAERGQVAGPDDDRRTYAHFSLLLPHPGLEADETGDDA